MVIPKVTRQIQIKSAKKADSLSFKIHVAYWHLADIQTEPGMSAFAVRADIASHSVKVRLWPKADFGVRKKDVQAP